jgi:hypothetical protein
MKGKDGWEIKMEEREEGKEGEEGDSGGAR